MGSETYIAYWSGEEPTGAGKAPTLADTPDYVDIVPLFPVAVAADGSLDFHRLERHNSRETIKDWMAEIRKRQEERPRKTRFTLCLSGDVFPVLDPAAFAGTVRAACDDWGVDGVTIDYRPAGDDPGIVDVVTAIRAALPEGALMTAPIDGSWLARPALLKDFAAPFTCLSTLDCAPYPDYATTLKNFNAYAAAIGDAGKLAIGVSCVGMGEGNATPLHDVVKLCGYEPAVGRKCGVMLYTLSHDVASNGNGYPDGTYTLTVHEDLP